MRTRRVFDLGFAMGRLEVLEDSDNTPMLTLMTPATDGENASSVVVSEWENLSALAMVLLEFTAGWRRDQMGPDSAEDLEDDPGHSAD